MLAFASSKESVIKGFNLSFSQQANFELVIRFEVVTKAKLVVNNSTREFVADSGSKIKAIVGSTISDCFRRTCSAIMSY